MKKIIAILAMLMMIGAVSALPTTVDLTWDGAGNFQTTFTAGDDSVTNFQTGGNVIFGEFHGVDSDDNPYTYGVDSTETSVKASVTGGGFIEYKFEKTDNYESMYGDSGQESYTLIDSVGGTADFAWRSSSNYARLNSNNYGWQANDQIQATGDHYIYHSFSISDDEGADIIVDVDGTTAITDMEERHWGSSYEFGHGSCYTNANVAIDGAGIFDLNAFADNSITTEATGISVTGPGAYYNVHATFGSGFHFDNFALSGN